jgi:hypothetical protein
MTSGPLGPAGVISFLGPTVDVRVDADRNRLVLSEAVLFDPVVGQAAEHLAQ